MGRYQQVSTSSKNFLGSSMVNIEDCGWCNKLRNWAIDSATILFDDNHNDLRALPKTVRLQILVVLITGNNLLVVITAGMNAV